MGRPGPGIRASGVTVPPLAGGATVAPAPLAPACAVPSGTVTGVVVAPEAPGVEELAGGAESFFFPMVVTTNSPTTRISTPTTAIWTVGLSFSAFLISPQPPLPRRRWRSPARSRRSEEHTSELQSRFELVCRLLLEKKKKQILIILFFKKKKK